MSPTGSHWGGPPPPAAVVPAPVVPAVVPAAVVPAAVVADPVVVADAPPLLSSPQPAANAAITMAAAPASTRVRMEVPPRCFDPPSPWVCWYHGRSVGMVQRRAVSEAGTRAARPGRALQATLLTGPGPGPAGGQQASVRGGGRRPGPPGGGGR